MQPVNPFWVEHCTIEDRKKYYLSVDFSDRCQLYLYLWRGNWDKDPERPWRRIFLEDPNIIDDIRNNYELHYKETFYKRLMRAWGNSSDNVLDEYRLKIASLFE